MTLDYYFDGEWFEKDLRWYDIKNYFKSMDEKEFAELVEKAFYMWPKDEQNELLTDMDEPNFACPDFERWVRVDWDLCYTIVTEAEILEELEDELHDYFEDEARAEYEDMKLEPTDPYEQRGLSRADFY